MREFLVKTYLGALDKISQPFEESQDIGGVKNAAMTGYAICYFCKLIPVL